MQHPQLMAAHSSLPFSAAACHLHSAERNGDLQEAQSGGKLEWAAASQQGSCTQDLAAVLSSCRSVSTSTLFPSALASGPEGSGHLMEPIRRQV